MHATQKEEVFDFDLPKKSLFKLSELEAIGVMSVHKAKLMIYDGHMKATKNGRNWLVPRSEVIRILNNGWTGDKDNFEDLDELSELDTQG